jgi:hypothetical protein
MDTNLFLRWIAIACFGFLVAHLLHFIGEDFSNPHFINFGYWCFVGTLIGLGSRLFIWIVLSALSEN